jgi:hypothetical protein
MVFRFISAKFHSEIAVSQLAINWLLSKVTGEDVHDEGVTARSPVGTLDALQQPISPVMRQQRHPNPSDNGWPQIGPFFGI